MEHKTFLYSETVPLYPCALPPICCHSCIPDNHLGTCAHVPNLYLPGSCGLYKLVQLVYAVVHMLLIVCFLTMCCWFFLISLLIYVRSRAINTNGISFLSMMVMSAG
jgi:hypothetical protein